MSLDLHRIAEMFMGSMDRAKSKGEYGKAARYADMAANYEYAALAALKESHPERVKTIALIEESAWWLHVASEEYRRRGDQDDLPPL